MDRIGRNYRQGKILAVGEACMAIFWPTPVFRERTRRLWALNKRDHNFCVCSRLLRKEERYRWIRLNQKRKSNFARVEAFFISRPKLLFVWLNWQRISQQRRSRTSAKSNMFSPSHTRPSRSWQVCFNVECPKIPHLAAGHLEALQHKSSWQVAVLCSCLASVCWQLAFGLSHINALVIGGSQIIAFPAYQLVCASSHGLTLYPLHTSSRLLLAITYCTQHWMERIVLSPAWANNVYFNSCWTNLSLSLSPFSLSPLFEEFAQKSWIFFANPTGLSLSTWGKISGYTFEKIMLQPRSLGSHMKVSAAAALLQKTIVIYTACTKTIRRWLSYKLLFPVAGTSLREEKI